MTFGQECFLLFFFVVLLKCSQLQHIFHHQIHILYLNIGLKQSYYFFTKHKLFDMPGA